MSTLTLTVNALRKSEMEYHGKFEHTLGQIQNIFIMIRIGICCTSLLQLIQTVTPTLPGFQGLKRCIQYMSSHPHKPIFILLIIMLSQMLSDLNGVGIHNPKLSIITSRRGSC